MALDGIIDARRVAPHLPGPPLPALHPPLPGRGGRKTRGTATAVSFSSPSLPGRVGGGLGERGWGVRAYATFASTARASKSPTCEVVIEPPRSGVVRPSRIERATA